MSQRNDVKDIQHTFEVAGEQYLKDMTAELNAILEECNLKGDVEYRYGAEGKRKGVLVIDCSSPRMIPAICFHYYTKSGVASKHVSHRIRCIKSTEYVRNRLQESYTWC